MIIALFKENDYDIILFEWLLNYPQRIMIISFSMNDNEIIQREW